MTTVGGTGAPLGPVRSGERHPRASGFRDGLAAAAAIVAMALAAGVLAVQAPGRGSPGPTGTGEAALVVVTPEPTLPTPAEATVGPVLSPPPIAPLTVVWIPPDDYVRGTEMLPGCTFSFDFGPPADGPIWRTCAGPEGPTEPLGTLYASAGATVSIENSTFTPSTKPSFPAVACGTVTRASGFVADASCHVTYAAGERGEFTFGLPPARGRWVVAVRGCLQSIAAACGAWYAKIDTADPPPPPY